MYSLEFRESERLILENKNNEELRTEHLAGPIVNGSIDHT